MAQMLSELSFFIINVHHSSKSNQYGSVFPPYLQVVRLPRPDELRNQEVGVEKVHVLI